MGTVHVDVWLLSHRIIPLVCRTNIERGPVMRGLQPKMCSNCKTRASKSKSHLIKDEEDRVTKKWVFQLSLGINEGLSESLSWNNDVSERDEVQQGWQDQKNRFWGIFSWTQTLWNCPHYRVSNVLNVPLVKTIPKNIHLWHQKYRSLIPSKASVRKSCRLRSNSTT